MKAQRIAINPETIQRRQLRNGMSLLIYENHSSPSAILSGYLRVGAIHDEPHKPGVAHLTANTLSRGTIHRTFQQFNEETEAAAANVHVSCGRHLTTFYGKSLAEDFSLIAGVLADLLRHPIFPEDEINKARGQLITSLKELEDDPRGLSSRMFRELLFGSTHPYGRALEGTLESVPQISRDDLISFHDRTYQPAGGVLAVVGDVTPDAIHEVLERELGDWQPPIECPPLAVAEPLPPEKAQQRELSMPNKSQADLVLGFLGPSRFSEDYYASAVSDVILGQLGLMGRLGEVVRDKMGLAYYVFSSIDAGLKPGPWFVRAGINPANVSKAIEAINKELERLCDNLVEEEELADTKSYLTGILPLQMEDNEGIAGIITQMELYNLGFDFIERYSSIINAITRQEIQAAAQHYLLLDRPTMAIAGPSAHE
jgi:zinc protease